MNRLNVEADVEDARVRVGARMRASAGWFLREGRGGARVELRAGEWELSAKGRALVFTYWGESGARAWRVSAWGFEGERLLLEATRRMGAERALLELVPRAGVASAREAVAEARRAECERLASLFCEHAASAREGATLEGSTLEGSAFEDARAGLGRAGVTLERATLSAGARRGEPGRWARVLMRVGSERVAATAPVVPARAEDAESFLASSLLWLARLDDREAGARGPAGRGVRARPSAARRTLRLAATRALASALCERLPLLRESLRARVSVFEIDEGRRLMNQSRVPGLEELLDEAVPRLLRPPSSAPSELVESIVALAPDEIDVVRARRGETLRFRGLPFARVRRVAGRELLWFGAGDARRRTPLEESNAHELSNLIEELREHRRADAAGRRHALYRAAPEAWLESLLRRDVTRLDPGLRLAPLHAQFRASRSEGARPVDLLALRRDGRLVVIELKVSEDAALALQGADYWRRVESHRRRGHLTRARLFGDAEISDEPPLVYLIAPMLRFHRSFDALARSVSKQVETYRFDLAEDWRACVRVARRARIV